MSASVTQLPARRGPLEEQESRLLGAALHLGPAHAVLAALGIVSSDFTVELHAKAWGAVLRQAEAGVRVTHETVALAGLKQSRLTQDEAQRLERLAHSNTLDLPAFRIVAEAYRLERLRLRVAAALSAEHQRVLQGDFDPSVLAGRLSGMERELHRNAARLEDLTGDQQRLLERWDRNVAEKRQEYLATGIKVLDAEIGGLPRRGVSLLAADAGVGKTALLDSMIHSMLLTHEHLTLGLISPEDGVEHVPKRWLARETGWLLREIGSREMTQDEAARLQEIAARNDSLLRRVKGYRERDITGDQFIALCWQLAEMGVGAIAVDNFNKINLRGREDYHERVQRFADRLEHFADKAGVATLMLVHFADADTNQRGGKVTGSGGLQGGKALGRGARLRIDLHRKDRQLRGLIAKANELGEQGTVVQFTRQATAGLIDPDTGEKIDLAQEKALERKQRLDQQHAEARARARKAREERDAEKAAAKVTPVEPDAQLDLAEINRKLNEAAVEKPSGWGLSLVDPQAREGDE